MEVIMRTKSLLLLSGLVLPLAHSAYAEEMAHDHGGGVYQMFRTETDIGSNTKGDTIARWDMKGTIGTDDDKLYLKTEGERKASKLESAEFWALYSRNIATFWDAQVGLRYDDKPKSTAYLTLGFNGLAPYFFETEAHLFVSDKGDVSARIRREGDLQITQRFIIQHYAEMNLFVQDVPEQDIGSGVADAKIGIQPRYEFTRKFAPYVDMNYGRKFGETASIAKRNGEDKGELVGSVGLRLMF
jgi:copper resistance protein B